MRTLALLAALLLLAFQARAQTLQETADQVPAQKQPAVKDQVLVAEDQDVAVSFTGEERFSRQLTALDTFFTIWRIAKLIQLIASKTNLRIPMKSCLCRPQDQCPHSKVNKVLERFSWACRRFGGQYKLCCK